MFRLAPREEHALREYEGASGRISPRAREQMNCQEHASRAVCSRIPDQWKPAPTLLNSSSFTRLFISVLSLTSFSYRFVRVRAVFLGATQFSLLSIERAPRRMGVPAPKLIIQVAALSQNDFHV